MPEANPAREKEISTKLGWRDTILVLAGLGIVGAAALFTFYQSSHERQIQDQEEEQKARVSIHVLPGLCDESSSYPLGIGVFNKSAKTVNEVFFCISARRPGYSKDLAPDGCHTWDKIIAPGENHAACWPYPNLWDPDRTVSDKSKLEYSVPRLRVTF